MSLRVPEEPNVWLTKCQLLKGDLELVHMDEHCQPYIVRNTIWIKFQIHLLVIYCKQNAFWPPAITEIHISTEHFFDVRETWQVCKTKLRTFPLPKICRLEIPTTPFLWAQLQMLLSPRDLSHCKSVLLSYSAFILQQRTGKKTFKICFRKYTIPSAFTINVKYYIWGHGDLGKK
jgi:hypothetical protein